MPMSAAQSLPKLRQAGFLEKFSTTRHALGLYSNIAISAYYSRPTPCDDLEPLVFSALAQVVPRHPALSSLPVNEDSPNAYFAQLPQIDLRDVVTFIDREQPLAKPDDELRRLLDSQHNTDYMQRYGELPYWRVVVLRDPNNTSDFTVCFVYAHSIGDGTSGLAFHRDFHSALTRSDTQYSPIVVPTGATMVPCLEDLHKLPLSARFLLAAQWNEWFPKSASSEWKGKPINLGPELRTRRITWVTFSQQTIKSLLALSRQHSVTLTCVFQAALAASLFTDIPTHYDRLNVDGAVSLRRFIPAIDDNSFGNYVSRYMHTHHRSEVGASLAADPDTRQAVWQEAQRVKKSIDAEVGKNGKDTISALLRWAGPLVPFFKKRHNQPRGESFELSNIGVFKYSQQPAESEWRIGGMVFSQSADVCGPPFHATLVTGGDGCLTATFSWLDAMLEAEWVEKVAKDFETAITNLSQSAST